MSKLALSLLVVSLVCVERVEAAAGGPPSAFLMEESAATAPGWTPMREVAHFPMAIRVSEMPRGIDQLGISEATLHDVVNARLREHEVPLVAYSPKSLMPYLLVTLRVVALQPQAHAAGIAFVLSLEVMDPVILDCSGQGYAPVLIWQRGNVGFTLLPNYTHTIQSWLSALVDGFVLDYRQASKTVPRSRYVQRVADQHACVMN